MLGFGAEGREVAWDASPREWKKLEELIEIFIILMW